MDSPLFKPAAIAATACTAVQAGVWFVLSLLALLTSVEVLGPTSEKDLLDYSSVTGFFNLIIVNCYFPRSFSTCCEDAFILSGNPLMGISIVYIIGGVVWICSSILLLLDLTNKQKNTVNLTLSWAGVTWTISLLDLVVAILFGVDYHYILTTCKSSIAASVAGMLMSLSARGYVLWVLNVVAASLLFRAAFKESSDSSRSRRYSGSSSSSVYNSPADALQDSRSMVYQQQQPWVTSGTIPRTRPSSTTGQYPPLRAWDGYQEDGGRAAQPTRSAPPHARAIEPPRVASSPAPGPAQNGFGYAEVQRGGLAARMAQGPPSQFGSQRGAAPAPPTHHQQQQQQQRLPRATTGAAIPEPDYDAGNAPRRSVLKKSPSSAAPPPPAGDWRQPAQPQSGRGWPAQQPQPPQVPMSPDGRGGWRPSSNDNRWGGYDNRGYDNRDWQDGGGGAGRGGGGGGGGGDRWGRTGF